MKVKAILISAFAGIVAISAAGASAAYLLKQNNSSFSSSFNSGNTFNTNLNNFNSTSRTEVVGRNFSLTIQRHAASEVELTNQQEATYTMKIQQDEKSAEQGTIYFVDKQNQKDDLQTITFKPGDKIQVGVKFKKENTGPEKLTIRDLLVWGKNANHFVKTEKNSNDDNYTIIMPLEDEAKNLDGTSWLYETGTEINVKATFIKESIGDKTKWTHGAYFGDLNGYVYNLTNDVKWSDIKQSVYKTFENADKTQPIDVYVYLNGFNLTIDEKITEDFIPSGWALHFHDNDNETKLKNKQFGKILVGEKVEEAIIDIKGSLHLGKSVEFDMIHTTNGVRFLSSQEAKTWVGVVSNHPNEQQDK